jgi:hypothetical protein
MPDSTITGLSNADALSGSEYVPIDQGGATVKTTTQAIADLAGAPAVGDITGLGSGVSTWLATPSSANLASAVTDETGSGLLVFATSPSLTTPSLGVASATSINKVALTAPATAATLTIANNKTVTVNNTLTLAGTDSTTMTFPSTTATIARTDAAQTFTGVQTFSSAPIHSTLTAGRIPYVGASKDILDAANFQWDNTNSALTVGTTGSGNPSVISIYGFKSTNGPSQVQTANGSNGNAAYAAFVAVNDSATASTFLVTRGTGFSTTGLSVASGSEIVSTNNLVLWTINSNSIIISAGGQNNEGMRVDNNKNVTIGTAALATNATNGFIYIPTCAGAPSGTPTSKTGRVPMIYDTTNNNFYIYNSGWKKTTTFS